MLPAAFLCGIFAVIGGFVVTDFLELEDSVAGPLVLALIAPLRARGQPQRWQRASSSPWSGGDPGSGDCGGGDGGGGGGDCGGGGD